MWVGGLSLRMAMSLIDSCWLQAAVLSSLCVQDMENLQPWVENTPVLRARKMDVSSATWARAFQKGDLTVSMSPCDIYR